LVRSTFKLIIFPSKGEDRSSFFLERIAEHSADYLKPHDRILIWGFSALVASFIEKTVASKSRKTPITLLVSGSSNDAIDYQRILRKQVESKMLQIVVIGDGAAFTVMPIVQKVFLDRILRRYFM
jgi:translation initiation factor 2B subunit (eIF-2B alpha/beta/delta family)